MIDQGTSRRPATTLERMMAIGRRDLAIELSYPISLVARAGGIASTIATFYFIARIVDPGKLDQYGGHYFEFVLVGLLVGNLATVGLGSFTQTIGYEQSSGTLEILLAMPTSLPTFFAGALLVPVGFIIVETSIVFSIAVLFLGSHFQATGALTALLAVPPILAIYAAVGACSAAFLVLSKRGDPFTPLLTKLTNFLAGALFPVAVLPGPLQSVAKLLPPFYALEVLRAGMLNGASIGDVWGDYLILVGWAVVALPLSLLVFRWALRAARQTGTLGAY